MIGRFDRIDLGRSERLIVSAPIRSGRVRSLVARYFHASSVQRPAPDIPARWRHSAPRADAADAPASVFARSTMSSFAATRFSAPPRFASHSYSSSRRDVAPRRTSSSSPPSRLAPRNTNRGDLATTSSARAGRAADPPAPEGGFGVVITGATKGVGYAMAREFLSRGDRVCICGRSQTRVDAAVAALRAEFPGSCVSGTACDVTDPRDVDAFGDYAASTVGVIHRWLNNAGMVSSREPLMSVEPSEVIQVCNTNLTGAILCCQKAVRLMQAQPAAGKSNPPGATPQSYHVYNFGFSAWGASFSKSTCTHKATKRGLSQLTQSLSEELVEAGVDAVGIHQLSPGMVLTDLLLEGANPVAKRFFNVLAEEPEAVAADVVPKVRATAGTNTSVEFLTLPDAVRRVVFGVPQILGGGRFFDGRGNRVVEDGARYKPNGVRLLYDEMQ